MVSIWMNAKIVLLKHTLRIYRLNVRRTVIAHFKFLFQKPQPGYSSKQHDENIAELSSADMNKFCGMGT